MKHKKICMICVFSLLTISLNPQAEELLKRRNIESSLTCENGPTKIKDQSELKLVFGDYSEEDGNLKIVSKKPLKIHVFAETFRGDSSKVIDTLVKKYLISNIYRVFAFTDIDEVTVTSSPKQVNISVGSKNSKFLKSPSYTITKTREQALSDLRKYTNAKSFNDLFDKSPICTPSNLSNQFLYDDQGGIGVTIIF